MSMRSDIGKDLNHRALASGISSRRSCETEPFLIMRQEYQTPFLSSIAEREEELPPDVCPGIASDGTEAVPPTGKRSRFSKSNGGSGSVPTAGGAIPGHTPRGHFRRDGSFMPAGQVVLQAPVRRVQ